MVPPSTRQLVPVHALGVDVDIEVAGSDDAQVAEHIQAVERAWSRCLRSDHDAATGPAGSPEVVRIELDSPTSAETTVRADPEDTGGHEPRRRFRSSSVANSLHLLSSNVTLTAIEAQRGRLLMLHACGLADPATGGVVALCGPSGMGKTTASRALARTFGYVTDETVAIDQRGSVTAYPKPLSIVQKGAIKRQLSPDELELVRAPGAELSLSGLLLLSRMEEPTPVTIEPIELIDAIVELVPHVSYLDSLDLPLQYMRGVIEKVGGVRRVVYSDSAELADVLQGVFSG